MSSTKKLKRLARERADRNGEAYADALQKIKRAHAASLGYVNLPGADTKANIEAAASALAWATTAAISVPRVFIPAINWAWIENLNEGVFREIVRHHDKSAARISAAMKPVREMNISVDFLSSMTELNRRLTWMASSNTFMTKSMAQTSRQLNELTTGLASTMKTIQALNNSSALRSIRNIHAAIQPLMSQQLR